MMNIAAIQSPVLRGLTQEISVVMTPYNQASSMRIFQSRDCAFLQITFKGAHAFTVYLQKEQLRIGVPLNPLGCLQTSNTVTAGHFMQESVLPRRDQDVRCLEVLCTALFAVSSTGAPAGAGEGYSRQSKAAQQAAAAAGAAPYGSSKAVPLLHDPPRDHSSLKCSSSHWPPPSAIAQMQKRRCLPADCSDGCSQGVRTRRLTVLRHSVQAHTASWIFSTRRAGCRARTSWGTRAWTSRESKLPPFAAFSVPSGRSWMPHRAT
eukprot:262139-Pelagomonas_calceolata.AAC.1